MNCENIKELLLTVYIDNEIGTKLKAQVDSHLSGCPPCQKFKEELLSTVKAPFKDVEKLEVPQNLWSNIKEALPKQNQEKLSLSHTLEGVHDFLFGHRKPAFAFAASLLVAVIAINFIQPRINQKNLSKTVLNENVDFIFYLEDRKGSNYGRIDLNTGIEEFFL